MTSLDGTLGRTRPRRLLVLVFSTCALVFMGCPGGEDPIPSGTDSGTTKKMGGPPVIEDVTPAPLLRGLEAEIHGTGFSTEDGLLIRLASDYISPTAVLPSLITFDVPTTTPLGTTTLWINQGPATSNNWGVVVENPPGAPYISYIIPVSAFPGNAINVSGTFPISGTQFYVGEVEADTWSAGPGGGVFIVPDLPPGDYEVTADANGLSSNAVDLTVY